MSGIKMENQPHSISVSWKIPNWPRNSCSLLFIKNDKKTGATADGEIAEKEVYELDQSVIEE